MTIVSAPTLLPADRPADDLLVRQYSQWGLVARRFLRHRMAVAGACIVLLMAALGSLAGYSGGMVDAVLMRIVDAFLAVPFLLLLILFSAQLTDRGPLVYAVMFGLLGWPGIARLVRGYMLSLREREFAEAARALGVSSWGVILRHLLPNALDILVVSFTLNIARSE